MDGYYYYPPYSHSNHYHQPPCHVCYTSCLPEYNHFLPPNLSHEDLLANYHYRSYYLHHHHLHSQPLRPPPQPPPFSHPYSPFSQPSTPTFHSPSQIYSEQHPSQLLSFPQWPTPDPPHHLPIAGHTPVRDTLVEIKEKLIKVQEYLTTNKETRLINKEKEKHIVTCQFSSSTEEETPTNTALSPSTTESPQSLLFPPSSLASDKIKEKEEESSMPPCESPRTLPSLPRAPPQKSLPRPWPPWFSPQAEKAEPDLRPMLSLAPPQQAPQPPRAPPCETPTQPSHITADKGKATTQEDAVCCLPPPRKPPWYPLALLPEIALMAQSSSLKLSPPWEPLPQQQVPPPETMSEQLSSSGKTKDFEGTNLEEENGEADPSCVLFHNALLAPKMLPSSKPLDQGFIPKYCDVARSQSTTTSTLRVKRCEHLPFSRCKCSSVVSFITYGPHPPAMFLTSTMRSMPLNFNSYPPGVILTKKTTNAYVASFVISLWVYTRSNVVGPMNFLVTSKFHEDIETFPHAGHTISLRKREVNYVEWANQDPSLLLENEFNFYQKLHATFNLEDKVDFQGIGNDRMLICLVIRKGIG